MIGVSVVITTYKRETALIDEAIDSVRRQTVQPIELILVDDNGVGTEWQIRNRERYGNDPFIRYIPNPKNSGAQYSRNTGILAARGDFVAFLDDDDFWVETKLEKQLRAFEDPDVGLVFCQGYTIEGDDVKNKTVYLSSANFVKNPSFEQLLVRDVIGTTTQALIRKDCFAGVGMFDPDMPARQDYEMWLRLSRRYRIVGVEEKLFYYRIHREERISQNPKKTIAGYKLLLKKYADDFKKHPEATANKYYLIGKTYLKHRDYLPAVLYCARAFFKCPGYMINGLLKSKRRA